MILPYVWPSHCSTRSVVGPKKRGIHTHKVGMGPRVVAREAVIWYTNMACINSSQRGVYEEI